MPLAAHTNASAAVILIAGRGLRLAARHHALPCAMRAGSRVPVSDESRPVNLALQAPAGSSFASQVTASDDRFPTARAAAKPKALPVLVFPDLVQNGETAKYGSRKYV